MSNGRLSRAVRKKQLERQKTLDVRTEYVAKTGIVERPTDVIGRTEPRGKGVEGYKLRPTKRGDER